MMTRHAAPESSPHRPGRGPRPPASWRARLAGAAARAAGAAARRARGAGVGALLALGAGCSAIYPEVQTPLRAPIAGQTLQPPPERHFVWVAVEEGEVPRRTRDGRRWRDSKTGAPNPFAIVFVNGRELLRTNPVSDSFDPRWEDAPRGNFRFNAGDRVRVELWDAGLVNHAICVRELGPVSERWADQGRVDARCEDGARVTLRWEPAHGRHGYGFSYEFHTYDDVFVSRVFAESPAARAGLKAGDQLVSLGGRPARSMKRGEVQSYLNAPRAEGVRLRVRRPDGTEADLALKEGAVYPLFSEVGAVP
ncbi:MAG TPA: PDZ domain-containing protein [Polyangiaceae bacterium]|nr:PDZ domain-containing protein [Polyangiaceae bacterium]